MNRRSFLRALGIGATAVAAAPVLALVPARVPCVRTEEITNIRNTVRVVGDTVQVRLPQRFLVTEATRLVPQRLGPLKEQA